MSQTPNPLGTLQTFTADGAAHGFHSLPALAKAGLDVSRLPVSIRIVLESLLRNCDGKRVTRARGADARELEGEGGRARRKFPSSSRASCCRTSPACRSSSTSPPCAPPSAKLGKNPKMIEPLVPVDLVVDHSVQVDFSGSAEALAKNLEIEFTRNRERYQFLKWGMQAFETFKVVPPGIGIVHQVNLEYLAKGVLDRRGRRRATPTRSSAPTRTPR